MKTLFVCSLLFIKIQFFPNAQLLLWMTIAVILDLVTGIAKAIVKGEARTSAGYRKTIIKVFQYVGAIAAAVILQNVGSINDATKALLSYVNDGLTVFITYIEVTSIFENLYEVDNKTVLSKYFYEPILKILTFQIKNNPLAKQAESLTEDNKS
jgi:hypothetical protein